MLTFAASKTPPLENLAASVREIVGYGKKRSFFISLLVIPFSRRLESEIKNILDGLVAGQSGNCSTPAENV